MAKSLLQAGTSDNPVGEDNGPRFEGKAITSLRNTYHGGTETRRFLLKTVGEQTFHFRPVGEGPVEERPFVAARGNHYDPAL
jgi:hypothetical protein